jgi:Peptidase C13 family
VRFVAVLAAALLVASCGMDDRAPPSCPVPVAGPSSSAPARAAAGTPAAASWRALLVAGDTSSPAFDNGVNTLRERLSERGVSDIRVLSANAGTAQAMANPANVVRALRGDPPGACLVYLTSHGNTDGVFLRPGQCSMGSTALDQALAEGCGGAPTVVVISACHSGVFLNETMRQPNRVILTAAARDRVSFGCSADNDFTYYDQCFLQQLETATTWGGLAAGTKRCVEGLERRLGVRQSSDPQLFVGSEVANLRLPGR